jgi:hypothetical protein
MLADVIAAWIAIAAAMALGCTPATGPVSAPAAGTTAAAVPPVAGGPAAAASPAAASSAPAPGGATGDREPATVASAAGPAGTGAGVPGDVEPSGRWDRSPAWCGQSLAVLAGARLLFGPSVGKLASIALGRPFQVMGWSPDCSRIVLAGPSVAVLDVATRALRDLPAVLPGEARIRPWTSPWLQPTIAWSPNGARFAVVYGPNGGPRPDRGEDAVFVIDEAAGTTERLPAPPGEVTGLGWASDTACLVGVGIVAGMRLRDVRLYRVTSQKAEPLGGSYAAVALSATNPPHAAARRADGAIVALDPTTGAERPLAPAGYLVGLSADGLAVILAADRAAGMASGLVSVPHAGGAARQLGAAGGGPREAPEHGYGPAGAFVVSHTDGRRYVLDRGAPQAPTPVYDATRYSKVIEGMRSSPSVILARVAPDGSRVAILEAVYVRDITPPNGGCTWAWRVTLRLVEVALDAPGARPAVFPIGEDSRCAVE